MADVPHFRVPFGWSEDGTHVAEVEQDSIADVAGCVEVILRTPRGSREELPEFGTPSPVFTAPFKIDGARRAVAEWEPRAQVTIEEGVSALELGLRRVGVNVDTGGR